MLNSDLFFTIFENLTLSELKQLEFVSKELKYDVSLFLEKKMEENKKKDFSNEFLNNLKIYSEYDFEKTILNFIGNDVLLKIRFSLSLFTNFKPKKKVFDTLIYTVGDINQKDIFGKTLLYYACSNYNDKKIIVKKLLYMGADPNIKDEKGYTILIDIIRRYNSLRDDFDLINLLLESGANPCLTDCQNNTILHHIVIFIRDNSFEKTFNLFLELGVDPDIKNSTGFTPSQMLYYQSGKTATFIRKQTRIIKRKKFIKKIFSLLF